MARYAQSSINEVSRRSSLSDIVSGYVKLKRNGTSYVGLCPFHKEKTPSFHVDEDKQLFYCFGCGAGGNVFDFIMRAENLDFVDTLQFLAQRAGVTLEEEQGANRAVREEESARRKRILEMNRLAARHFYSNLSKPEAEHARAYMNRRGLSKQTAVKFGVGFAPDSWDDLFKHLKNEGYTAEEIVTAGLAVKNEKGRIYDKFRNRLMFPIIDVRGNVIAFGGRALAEGDPAKYMNSPETPVFHKGRHLFSLNLAKTFGAKDGLILVEGYMDVISLYQAGIQNAVAGLGTALTEDQAKLIKRYASQVYVCYDSDEAGQKAAQKAIGLLTEAGNTVKVISYRGAKDPDEYIQKKGAQSFRALLHDSKESLEYQLLRLRQQYDIFDVSQKISFLTETAKILSGIDSEMTREVYIKRLAAETDISAEAIKTEISKLIYYKNKKETRKEIYAESRPERLAGNFGAVSSEQSTATYKAERLLLNLLFFHRKVYEMVGDRIEGDWFTGAEHKELFGQILSYCKQEQEPDASQFLNALEAEDKRQKAASILYENFSGEAVQAAKEAAEKLETAFLKKKAGQLVKEGKVKEANEILQRIKGRRG